MNEVHTYDTSQVSVYQLNSSHVLVGECGGLSAVFDVYNSYAMPGCYAVETEHGTLYLGSTDLVEVLT